jgi:hypothetical protein
MVITKSRSISLMMSELEEIKNGFEETRRKYAKYLPKVDPALLEDLLLRQSAEPEIAQTYMLEVFTEPGLETDYIRQYVIGRTGNSPAIYDHGTHFAVHQTLTLDELAEISELQGVLEITGEYTGGGIGTWSASHEPKVAMHTKEITRRMPKEAGEK